MTADSAAQGLQTPQPPDAAEPAAPATHLPSIQRRLLAALAVTGLLWSLAAIVAVGLVVRHEVDEVLDQGLKEAAEIIYGVFQLNPALMAPGSPSTLPAPAHQEQLVWQLLDAQGQVTLRSHRAPAQPLLPARQHGFVQAADWHIYALPSPSAASPAAPAGTLAVAHPKRERNEARHEALLYPAVATTLIGLLAIIWLRHRTRRELQPLLELAQLVRQHDPLGPQPALPLATRDELAPVHGAIDELSKRLAQRVAREQAFSAHAAHALRTPLATVVANLAAAQQRVDDLQTRALLQRSRQATHRLRSVVSALLTLFRSGSQPHVQAVSLPTLVAQLPFDMLEVRVSEAPAPSGQEYAQLMADPDLLSAALANLLDNAQRHNARHVWVKGERTPNEGYRITLVDDGDGIDDAQRARLQAALDSEDYAALPGLGLMLADLVARAHGGRCRLSPPAEGQAAGSRIVLDLRAGPAG
jgi:two-component system OmpR family sensor kinase